MSFFDDYVAEGLCCQSCGTLIGDEPGFARFCDGCDPERQRPAKAKPKQKRRGR